MFRAFHYFAGPVFYSSYNLFFFSFSFLMSHLTYLVIVLTDEWMKFPRTQDDDREWANVDEWTTSRFFYEINKNSK